MPISTWAVPFLLHNQDSSWPKIYDRHGLTVSATELIAKDKGMNKTFHDPHGVYNLVVYIHIWQKIININIKLQYW